jgi:hypothetical protein
MVEQFHAGQRFSAKEPRTNIHAATGEETGFISAERHEPVRARFDDRAAEPSEPTAPANPLDFRADYYYNVVVMPGDLASRASANAPFG